MANGYTLPTRKMVSQEDAHLIEKADIPRSRFEGSWTRKTSFNAGYLVPIMVDEVLPGDHLEYDVTAYVRMATPLFPLMDNQRIDTFFFYVPNRLVMDKWANLMGEEDENSSTNFTVPQVNLAIPMTDGDLYDHMGIPKTQMAMDVNALPFRAYNLIWNQWFRDQNLQAQLLVPKGAGPDVMSTYQLKRRNKAHDYFTSALPWPQKFVPPALNMSGIAPVMGIGVNSSSASIASSPSYKQYDGTGLSPTWAAQSATNGFAVAVNQTGNNSLPLVYADLANSGGININTLRNAFLVQGLLERDARGGTRYTELIKSHFGATNPDFRLQRPEYIGGGQTPLQITPIAQTAPVEGASPSVVGQLGAAGVAAGQHRASFAATEHGYIIGLINVRTDISYQQGLHKLWKRKTRFDFYWPALAGLGEQTVLRHEIYCTGNPTNDDQVFGYQERYQEYRTRTSEVTGLMRSTATGTLDMWHLAQKFTAAPTLGGGFLEEDPPMERVLAAGSLAIVNGGQTYLADILFRRTAVRAMPMYGTPVLLGRF